MPTFRQDTKIGGMVPLIKTDDYSDKSVTEKKLADGAITSEKLSKNVKDLLSAATGLPDDLIDSVGSMDSHFKDLSNRFPVKGSDIDVNAVSYDKLDKSLIVGQKGDSERSVMSQGAVSRELESLESNIPVPDEEDLTSIEGENNKLRFSFADRLYSPQNFSGKGYKILRKNIKPVSLAVTKIVVSSVPISNGYLAFIINGVESHIDVVASSDKTTDKVADKIAAKLSETMTEYEVSKNTSTITLTRKFGGEVTTPSSFSAVSTGVSCSIADSTKREFRNILTPIMINQPNTIYEIRYDFDLDGKTIEVPENCVLKFEGGKLDNGTINFSNTQLSGLINIPCDISGTTINSVFDITQFGAKNNDDSVDNSIVFNKLIKLNEDFRKPNIVYIPRGTFYIKNPITLVAYKKVIIVGDGRELSNIKAAAPLDYMIGSNDSIYINTNFYDFGICGNRIGNHSDETNISVIFTHESLAKCGFRLHSFKYCVMNGIYICDIDGSGIELSESWCSRFENLYLKNNYYGIKSVGSTILNSLYFSDSEYYQHLYSCINIVTTTFVHINQSTFERCGGPAIYSSGNITISKCYFEHLSINPMTELDNVKYKTCISTINGSSFSNIVIEKCSFDLHYNVNDDCKHLIFFAYKVKSVDINNNVFFTTEEVNSTLLVLGTTQNNLNRCSWVTLHQNYFRKKWDSFLLNNNYDFIDKTISNKYFATIQRVVIDKQIDDNNLYIYKNILNNYHTDIYKNGLKELNQTYLGRRVYSNDNSIEPNKERNYITFLNPFHIDDLIGKLAIFIFYTYEDGWVEHTKNLYISNTIIFNFEDYKIFTLPEVYILGTDDYTDVNYNWRCLAKEVSYIGNKRLLLPNSIILVTDDKSKYIKFVGNNPILYQYNTPHTTKDNLSLTKADDGFTIYDTALKKKILWNGTAWVNMDGTALVVQTSNE